jgi:hypothetical protein
MKSIIRYVVMISVVAALFLTSATPAMAGSNGQQISIYACNANGIVIQGYNQDNQWQTKTLSKEISKCGWFEISGWWWKGNVDVIATYYVTPEYPSFPGQSVTVNIPKSQSNNDFVTVNIPTPTARQWVQWRAETWVKDAVVYDNSKQHDGYRQDCSGYVSFAWSLSKSYSGDVWQSFANQIDFNNLQTGDALDNPEPGNNGHMLLFMGWVDKNAGTFVGFEENGYYGFARKSTYTLNSSNGTIKEGNYAYPGAYIAITKK